MADPRDTVIRRRHGDIPQDGLVPAPPMSPSSARRLTDEIRETLTIAYDKLVEAWWGRADLALGYESWDAYCAAEFTEARMLRPTPEQRREIVTAMRGEGMSTRAIGSALDVGVGTVHRDLASVPDGTDDSPATVIGLDGRQRPAAQPPRDLGDVLEERMPGTRADLARTSLRARWSKDMASAADIDLLDPDQVRAVIEDSEASVAIGTLRRLARWADRLDQAGQPGLRIAGGNDD